jgi:superfamily II DNA or RNA helicase
MMTATLKPRDYQTDAIEAVFTAWRDGLTRPAIVLPTGAGKTVVFSHLVKAFAASVGVLSPAGVKGARVMILVHRDELADQAIDKLRAIAPDLNVGKVKASDNEITADVLVCSVQTLAVQRRRGQVKGAERIAGAIGLIITDECHHAVAPSYQKVYADFPDALQLGVTATMARGDDVGLGSQWEEVVYSRSLTWMMSRGYLTGVKAVAVTMDELDLGSVKQSRGDYAAGGLGDALMEAHADDAIARAYIEHAKDRPGVVFTPTVATAEATAEAMNGAGIRSEVISGATPAAERHRIFADFRDGRVQALVNCMVLTEGFDAPWASCAVIARPTRSQPLYVQMVGRVLRPYPGKEDALVIDMVGASGSNKLRTLIDLEPGVVTTVNPMETLEEAIVREAEEANEVPKQGSIAFALKNKEINLFAGSDYAWARTKKGVLFVSGTGDTTVFLWPSSAGGFDVCTVSKGDRKWTRTDHQGLPAGEAMAWGEAVADDVAAFSPSRGASWRGKAPSEKMISFAQRLGVPTEGRRQGDVSQDIDVAMKSRMFDLYVPA